MFEFVNLATYKINKDENVHRFALRAKREKKRDRQKERERQKDPHNLLGEGLG